MIRQSLLLGWRGLAEVWHQKKLLVFLVAYPLIFMLVFGSAFGGDASPISVGMVVVTPLGGYDDALTEAFSSSFDGIDALNVRYEQQTRATAHEEAQYWIGDQGRVVVLVLPASIVPSGNGAVPIDIYYDARADPTEQSVALSIVDAVIAEFSDMLFAQQIASAESQEYLSPDQGDFIRAAAVPLEPATVPIAASGDEALSYIDYLVPGLVAMSILWTGVTGSSAGIVEDRVKGIRRRILSTPVSRGAVMVGDMLSQMVIVLIQVAILLLVAMVLYDLSIVGPIWLVALIVLVGTFGMIGIGLIIASFAKSADEASQAATLVNFPMMFLSGIFFPLSQGWMASVSKIFPLTYVNDALRDVMIRGEGISGVAQPLGISIVFAAAIFVIGTLLVMRGESI
ncbi:MAG: ABC transporter permease [Candidatus Methanofastidiosa archaeon]|nr:ABC transporter permease [Candidatus Methanofastidiosa archaeon]